ncbi:hypothetical protein QQS21_011954 [Conoideocrella luteorostrata]|uniref:GH18 domain-containing protein n=1 Tax=Conoideocrella luteorostrata TaxID=1105319 RepID=A0AAJ0CGN1_9HYPO|nr:hypothetical protein QQS21_011954 [Conoideocrella luteorostrata]
MKIPFITFLAVGAATVLAGSASVCPRSNNAHASGAALQKILDYKKSDHQIMAAYFRSWRDIASDPAQNKASMDDLPDCLDIAFVFPQGDEPDAFYTALKDRYVPALRSRGTKVVRTISIAALLDEKYANDPRGHEALATHLLDTYVNAHGLDGLDVDFENTLTASQLSQASGVFAALSKSLGPQSGTGKLLIFDTNQDGTAPLFRAVHPYVDYVLVQSYGRRVSGTQGTFNTYKPYISSRQYLIGFSFPEEHGAAWGDVTPPMRTSRAYQYAQWQPSGARKGGVFSYAVDRDGKVEGDDALAPTNYTWTRELIAAMNP